MKKMKLTIEYDGSKYHGWQCQDNAITVQAVISKGIKELTGEDIIPEGAGRTDSGVHAYGQVASFLTDSSIPPDNFASALNRFLPDDISIRNSEAVDDDFHARFSAKGKHYRYMILNTPQRSGLWGGRAWHVRQELNLDAMKEAARYFIGHHSFRAFCAAGHSTKTFDRIISTSSWGRDGNILTFDTEGNGYLYNMVRIMVGTMVDIGKGRFKPEIIEKAIESGERNDIGVTAPPHGLYLVEVYY